MSDSAASPEAAAAGARGGAVWRRRLGLAGAVVLGAVLLVAAWAKALDPLAFAEQIDAEGLAWLLPPSVWAILMVALEAGLGVALVLGARRPWSLAPATALTLLFLFLNGRAYWRYAHGTFEETGCGCFGNLVSRTPAEAFWQDLLLLVPPLLLAWWGREGSRRFGRRGWSALAAAAAAGILAFQAPRLPLDDLATRLAPGARVEEMCAGGTGEDSVRVCLDALVPPLSEGRHLVVISDLDDEVLLGAVERLNRTRVGDGGGLWLLTSATEEERMAFFWTQGPGFEIREVPAALLRPLYRALPRSFLVDGGTVIETWSGLPPEEVGEPPVS